jgi:hypothetical protein
MRHLLVTVLLLLLPVAADADVESYFPMSVNVTISVAGTVPLAGDDLVIDDTFHLRGLGDVFYIQASHSLVSNVTSVGFDVSGAGVSATGSVMTFESMDTSNRDASLHLVTPLYRLEFDVDAYAAVDVNPYAREASFGGMSDRIFYPGAIHVTVGEENSSLDGTASFSGTGHALPEPGTAVLLVLGATAMAVWRGRGKIAGAARNTGALRRPSTISA